MSAWRCLPEVARELRARVAELEAERVADGFGIQSLTADGGIATLTTAPTTEQARELVLAMSLACGRMLDDDQATNYVEFEVSPANQPGYVVHVRRAAGPSPHTLRREAEARADLAETRIAELESDRNVLTGQLKQSRARVAELEAQVDSDRLKAGAAVLNLECELEAAQRPPLGMRDIADTLAFLAIKTTRDDTDDIRPIAAKQLRADLTDVFEELLDRLPEGTIGEVREAQP